MTNKESKESDGESMESERKNIQRQLREKDETVRGHGQKYCILWSGSMGMERAKEYRGPTRKIY